MVIAQVEPSRVIYTETRRAFDSMLTLAIKRRGTGADPSGLLSCVQKVERRKAATTELPSAVAIATATDLFLRVMRQTARQASEARAIACMVR